MTLSHIAQVLPSIPSLRRASVPTLETVIQQLEKLESLENDDILVPVKDLRLTNEGTLTVAGQDQSFAFTDWSLSQLSHRLGIRWQTWFERNAVAPQEQAEEVNKRLRASVGTLRLRTTRVIPNGSAATGTLRALVSQQYTPLADSRIARILNSALEATVEERLHVLRCDVTDRSVTYVVQVAPDIDSGSAIVGTLSGTLTWTNSGVGFRSAALWSSIVRLICTNGMTVPLCDPLIFRRAHRGFDEDKVREAILKGLANLPNAFRRAARVLVEARSVRITDAVPIFRRLLAAARVPLKFLQEVEKAYAEEPGLEASAFAISQAITRFAHAGTVTPDQRFELERVAGSFLAEILPSVE